MIPVLDVYEQGPTPCLVILGLWGVGVVHADVQHKLVWKWRFEVMGAEGKPMKVQGMAVTTQTLKKMN